MRLIPGDILEIVEINPERLPKTECVWNSGDFGSMVKIKSITRPSADDVWVYLTEVEILNSLESGA